MKLIIKQYLTSLKERDELDVILPDLLSQLGLNVFSRPGRGTRQAGVDVAASGSLDGGKEKVYLLSIKAGDLTRSTWDGASDQSLRPSLNEILDIYIPNRLPAEHKNKEIAVCLCFGGDIQEQTREAVESYIKKNTRDNLLFEEWNGDKIASLILESFLREDLLPHIARSQLRKSLALLDEPQASYQHFSLLINSISSIESTKDKDQITAIRQISICLWILFTWARDTGNLESAYLSSEICLLHAWKIARGYKNLNTKAAKAVQSTFDSILQTYLHITSQYCEKIVPHTDKMHALSVAIQSSCELDVNLKLFDLLSRLSIKGIWNYWAAMSIGEEENKEVFDSIINKGAVLSEAVIQLIQNNPALRAVVKDEQIIDLSIAVLLLMAHEKNHNVIKEWLLEIVRRADIAHLMQDRYPCTLSSYNDLLEHPQKETEGYHQDVTSGSVLFPMIALFASMLGDRNLYSKVQSIKENHLSHSNFQFWYPDESSEAHFYTNSDVHGATLSDVCIDSSAEEFENQAFTECEHTPHFKNLSAVQSNLWPLIIVACRHYRIPIPLHLLKSLRESLKS